MRFDGSKVAEKRKALGISQRDLGERVGYPPGSAQQTISAWERGIWSPTVDILPLLALALDCGLSDLYTTSPREARTGAA